MAFYGQCLVSNTYLFIFLCQYMKWNTYIGSVWHCITKPKNSSSVFKRMSNLHFDTSICLIVIYKARNAFYSFLWSFINCNCILIHCLLIGDEYIGGTHQKGRRTSGSAITPCQTTRCTVLQYGYTRVHECKYNNIHLFWFIAHVHTYIRHYSPKKYCICMALPTPLRNGGRPAWPLKKAGFRKESSQTHIRFKNPFNFNSIFILKYLK